MKFCFPDLQSDFEKNVNIIYGIGKDYIPNNRRKTFASILQTPDPTFQDSQINQAYYFNQIYYNDEQEYQQQYHQSYINYNYYAQYQMLEIDQQQRKSGY
ncbi:unnamed protein product [Paramecium sonneborni]|uniref:Uncharacterized protein n=1 Tax=Paramecium sonneborni TaxID=65129 RepID=A0A8S1KK20_9CILI|nr:unnamed protein product [Paramecium sonneborni]